MSPLTMPTSASESRSKASAKASTSTAHIGFEAKLWLTADIAVYGHVWIPGWYGYSEVVQKTIGGNGREMSYAR